MMDSEKMADIDYLKEDLKINFPSYVMLLGGAVVMYAGVLGTEPGEENWWLISLGISQIGIGYMFRIMTRVCRIEEKLDEMMEVKEDDL